MLQHVVYHDYRDNPNGAGSHYLHNYTQMTYIAIKSVYLFISAW